MDWGKKKPKAQAFLPVRNGDYGTSVYRSHGASHPTLNRIGNTIAEGTRERTVYGRAILTLARISAVPTASLSLKAGRIPSLHRDIVGWPEKGGQKLIAEYLAIAAAFEPHDL